MKNKKEKITQQDIHNKLEEMDNKLESIKSDTHSLNRIASLSNSDIIIQELKKIIGTSKSRAVALHLTKDLIGASELADCLGIDIRNLSGVIKPLVGNRGYIVVLKKGREKFFQRSELVDLIGYESIEEFSTLIKAWKERRE